MALCSAAYRAHVKRHELSEARVGLPSLTTLTR